MVCDPWDMMCTLMPELVDLLSGKCFRDVPTCYQQYALLSCFVFLMQAQDAVAKKGESVAGTIEIFCTFFS